MQRHVYRLALNWILPWIIWGGLIWNLTTTAEANEAVAAVTSISASGEPATEDLYDVSKLPRAIRKIVFRSSVLGSRGEYQAAAEILEDHLQEFPDQDAALLRLYLAQNLSEMKETARAAAHYRRAVEFEPRLDRAWFGYAEASYQLQDYASAAEAFRNGYRVSPERPADVLYFAGTSWLLADRPQDALDVFSELLRSRSGSAQLKWYQGLIVAASRVGAPEKADAAVEHMLLTFTDDPEAWYLKYQHESGKRNYSSAAVALQLVGYLRPLTESDQKQLGDLYMILDVPYLASRLYAGIISNEGGPDDIERLGSALVAAHEFEEALALLNNAVVTGHSSRLWSLIGDINYMQQDYKSALGAYRQIADQDTTGRAWLMQGYCALELGERQAALDYLGRAASYPDQTDMAQILIERARRP